MITDNIYLFVYGSLRKGFHHPAYEYVSSYFTFVSEATVKGYLYDLGEYPAAIPATGDDNIKGELYKAKSAEDFVWAIEQLDVYEGVDAEKGEGEPLFKRELTEVTCGDTTIPAWIYWYNRSLANHNFIPSGDIMDVVERKSKL